MARKFRYPTHVPSGMSAEEVNEQERAKNLALNQKNIYRPPGATPMGLDPSQEIQRKLALAFDYDPRNPPPLKQLLAKFHAADPDVQAGMFAKGLAPVDAATGQKLLHNVGKSRSDIQESAVDDVGKRYRAGEIVSEMVNDKPQFFDMVTDEIPDPTDLSGQRSKKIKKKVPVNAGTLENLNAGIRQGRIQDPKTGKWATDTEILKPQVSAQSRMKAEEFQKILDLRQNAEILDAGFQSEIPPSAPAPVFRRPDTRGNMYDPSNRPITMEEFGTPLYNPGSRRISPPPMMGAPLTSAPAIASNLAPQPPAANPGWLNDGGPGRLAENVGAEVETGVGTIHKILAGGLNVVPKAFNSYAEFMRGSAARKLPLFANKEPVYDPRMDSSYYE